MKAFIFVALVASVAARGLNLDTIRLMKEKSLLERPVVDELLLKEKLGQRFPLEKTQEIERVLPVERDLVDEQLLKGIYNVDRVYTIEELYNTELFREYLTIPLFRQYIQYPIFQRYVSSVYFQRFWQIPTFRQYFLNPVLFYKYVYPIVQLFKNEYTLPTTQTIFGQDAEDIFGRQTVDDLVVKNRNVLPYVYGQQDELTRRNIFGLPTYAGQYPYTTTTTQGVNYKFLLDKIYKQLILQNQQQIVGEIKTDVKIAPVEKKFVVEPITGERQVIVEQPKIIDVKVDQKIVPVQKVLPVEDVVVPQQQYQVPIERQLVDKVVERQLIREALLKDLVKEKYLTPEVYETLVRDIPTIRREGRQSYEINTPFVTRRDQEIYAPFITRRDQEVNTPFVSRRDQGIFTPYMNRQVQGERVNLVNKLYNQLYNTEIPQIRENTVYDRLPIEQYLGNIVA